MKYIVDIDVFDTLFKVDSIGVFGIGKSVVDSEEDHSWSRIKSIEEFEELNSDYINEHFGDLQDTAYQRGLDDAWEAAKKVVLNPDDGGLSVLELNEIFNCATIQQVFRKYTLSEVIAKLKAYEEKQNNKFEFGDEIVDLNGVKGCVVSKDNEGLDTMYVLFDECRVPQYVTQSDYHKTGKHYDIEKILEGIKHD